jgi:hypothetical protein
MSHPGVPIIRIGNMNRGLPYPVNIHLPPASGLETRIQARCTGRDLDIVVPQVPERHEKLGRFMNAWSALESTLAHLLTSLTPLDGPDATLLAPKLGMKNMLELLEGLAHRKLEPDSVQALVKLLERVGKQNTKRNILVHGQWVLEANVLVRRGEAILAMQFLRETIPTDPEHEKAMANPRNQKERVRYSFTLKRIDAAIRDTDALNIEIEHLIPALRRKSVPLSEIPQLLLLSSPYQVKYPSPTERPSPTQASPEERNAPPSTAEG